MEQLTAFVTMGLVSLELIKERRRARSFVEKMVAEDLDYSTVILFYRIIEVTFCYQVPGIDIRRL
jgi:hypothetical protein